MKKLRIAFFGGTFVHQYIKKKCEKLGAKCYLLDKNSKCFAFKDKDFFNIDFNNIKRVHKFIKRNKINFLYISQSDVGIMAIAKLNKIFNLPGTDLSVARRLTNKYLIRKVLKKNNFFQPKFFHGRKNILLKENIIKKNFLMKPVDSSGSRGIYDIKKKSNISSLYKKSLKFSKSKKIIVEEKINGLEFGAQTFSINGVCKTVILHEDIMSKNNQKIPVGHIIPAKIFSSLKKRKIINQIKKAIKVLGVKNGPCNVDCIYTHDQKLFILEVSPRVGATCLPNMLEIYTGTDWDINTIKLFNGIKINSIKERKINVISHVFESYKSGIVKDIKIKKKIPNSKVKLLLKNGNKIEKFTDGTKLFGYIVAYSKKRQYLIENVLKFLRSIKIKFKHN